MEFGEPRRRHRMSLTPMIDVVFLLLVFFMLASRFGVPGQVPLSLGGGSASYSGPARLITVEADGLELNGVGQSQEAVLAALPGLTATQDDMIVLQAGDGVSLQRLMAVMQWLGTAGYGNLVLVE
ncbi:ExbD/TolR family protein [Celeribacter neptunius]|uniref:Biopolymer transport protein ExbD n=1 Tax=Celeribacter neptunius TaxID=588602 RepID=A0A1I3WUG8_9RHOB|nr:biopolymer transporter ExbD [Celeribacter neptunius]SFK10990.1 biopolymer transport protein ExbD [Celeribacter neptunius]